MLHIRIKTDPFAKHINSFLNFNSFMRKLIQVGCEVLKSECRAYKIIFNY